MGFFSEHVAGKVPQVTIYFWKCSRRRWVRLTFYFPPLYWFVIVAISTVGTLLSDNLTDGLGISLEITTPIAFIVLVIVFAGWYWSERDLSIHTIFTRRREAWYWLTVLVTFALGTAAGDLTAEQLDIGYGNSALLFAGCIVVAGLLWRLNKINGVVGFWTVYVLTRPLGASIGDLLSQNPADASSSSGSGSGTGSSSGESEGIPSGWNAGLNLGTTVTSMIFLGLIAIFVVFLTVSKKDRLRNSAIHPDATTEPTNHLVAEVQ